MKTAGRLISTASCIALAVSLSITGGVAQASTPAAPSATVTTRIATPTVGSTSLAKRCKQLQRTWKKKSRHLSATKRKALKRRLTATCKAAKKAAAAAAEQAAPKQSPPGPVTPVPAPQTPTPQPPTPQPPVPTPPPTPNDQTRVMCSIHNARLSELSGLVSSQLHPTALWTHNDSGDSARIFALNSNTCAIQAEVSLPGVTARDFEAIGRGKDAAGNPVLWIADIGDNAQTRTSVTLHRIPEPGVLTDQSVSTQAFSVTYADGPRNAEGILVSPEPGGAVWIVSKESNGGIYALTTGFQQGGSAVATRIADVPSYLTDAALDFDGDGIVLRRGDFGQTRQGSVPGSDPRSFTFPSQPQGEAVTFSADSSYLFIASEGVADLVRIPVSRLP